MGTILSSYYLLTSGKFKLRLVDIPSRTHHLRLVFVYFRPHFALSSSLWPIYRMEKAGTHHGIWQGHGFYLQNSYNMIRYLPNLKYLGITGSSIPPSLKLCFDTPHANLFFFTISPRVFDIVSLLVPWFCIPCTRLLRAVSSFLSMCSIHLNLQIFFFYSNH